MLKYVPLVLSAFRRNPVRNILTVITIAIAFSLFGVLKGFTLSFDSLIDNAPDTELFMYNRTMANGHFSLPVAHAKAVATIEGVNEVTYLDFFGGYYQDPQNMISAAAMNDGTYLRKAPDFVEISDEHIDAFEALRTGAIVGQYQLDEYGWTIGDRIPIAGGIPRRDGSTTWEFDIVGVWNATLEEIEERQMFVHYDYLNESRTTNTDTVGSIYIYADPTRSDVEMAEAIDSYFINSAAPTRTMSQRQQQKNRIERMGSVYLFVNVIVGIALAIVLLSVAGTLSQSIRERLPEFAVLSSMGFSTSAITGMAVAESLLICLVGAGVGLTAGFFLAPIIYQFMNQFPGPLPVSVFAWGFLIATTIGLLATVLPIQHLHRNNTVDTLAGR
ncbi:MAG: ABC transporter permease [Pseudomonadota bacterium]